MYIIVWEDEFGYLIIDTTAPHFNDYNLAVDYCIRQNQKFADVPYHKKRRVYSV